MEEIIKINEIIFFEKLALAGIIAGSVVLACVCLVLVSLYLEIKNK
jgi:hypothetical protein